MDAAKHTHKIKLVETHWLSGRSYYNCSCECGAYLASESRMRNCRVAFKAHVDQVSAIAKATGSTQ